MRSSLHEVNGAVEKVTKGYVIYRSSHAITTELPPSNFLHVYIKFTYGSDVALC